MEKTKIEISKMSIEDLESIKGILLHDFDDFWDFEVLKEDFSSSTSTFFVAKYNNIIIGFAIIKQICDEVELMNIVTKKNCRGIGIGSLMLEHIILYCKKNKIKCINLEVNSKNSIAITLYKKYNFRQVGLRKKYYNNTDDAILMTFNII